MTGIIVRFENYSLHNVDTVHLIEKLPMAQNVWDGCELLVCNRKFIIQTRCFFDFPGGVLLAQTPKEWPVGGALC